MKAFSITTMAIVLPLALSILNSQPAWAMRDMGEFDRLEMCAQKQKVANELIAIVPKNLTNYHQLERLNPLQYPPGAIRKAKLQALQWMREHRNSAQIQEQQLLRECDIGSSEKTLRGLEYTFDVLNMQLALAQIRSRPDFWIKISK